MYRHCKFLVSPALSALLLSAALCPASAQLTRVNAHTDSSSILIGQQFHLVLEAVSPSGDTQFGWPVVPDTFNEFQVIARNPIDTIASGNSKVYRQTITLTNFDSGLWKIPGFAFRMIPGNGVLTTDSLYLMVNTVPVDTTRPFRPIKAIREVPFNIMDYLLYILVGLATVVVLVLFILYLIRRKRPERPPPPPAAKEKPDETAFKALKKLESEKLWQQNLVKNYYTRLTDILRVYLEDQFSIPAMEQTTDELMHHIRNITIVSQQKDNLQIILDMADLVKFAKMQPMAADHEQCMKRALEIVDWTRPKKLNPENEMATK
ncbi:MAG TPA: hypothetical protein VNE41_07140 [Chitinophagaceae bacterium]|nr:hypothetical protein [Chitinophagaceae bacterium]